MYCPGVIQLETYPSANGDVVYITITCTLEEEIYVAEDMILEHETGTMRSPPGRCCATTADAGSTHLSKAERPSDPHRFKTPKA